jgi:hypothetical protein
MTYLIVTLVFISIVVFLMPSKNQARTQKQSLSLRDVPPPIKRDEAKRYEEKRYDGDPVLRKEISNLFARFIFSQLNKNGSFYIPDVGRWEVNSKSWPLSFVPRKSLRKQVKDGMTDRKRESKFHDRYSMDYDIWWKRARVQQTRDKLSTERKFYLALFEFYCNERFEQKNIRLHLKKDNKFIMNEIIFFGNQLRKNIIQNIISSKSITIEDLGSLSVKPRKITIHGHSSEIKKIYFKPTKKLIHHCKNIIKLKNKNST